MSLSPVLPKITGLILPLFIPAVVSAQTDTTVVLCNNNGIRTALGCIPASDPQAMISLIAGWAIGLAVTAAFVSIAYAGFLIVTAQGDVKKVTEAKTFLTSALLGLLLISIALVILNFAGVQILGVGSLGFSITP